MGDSDYIYRERKKLGGIKWNGKERWMGDDDDDESLNTHAIAFGVFFITCKSLI